MKRLAGDSVLNFGAKGVYDFLIIRIETALDHNERMRVRLAEQIFRLVYLIRSIYGDEDCSYFCRCPEGYIPGRQVRRPDGNLRSSLDTKGKGLIPNPKSGTVTMDVEKAIKEVKAGKVEYRLDKTAIIHCPIGKKSFGQEKLVENYTALIDAIVKAKPAAAKGTYLKSVVLASTMGPGVKVVPKN